MSFIGIGYSGSDKSALSSIVEEHKSWLVGDRRPNFFGESFLIFYDSNTAREFVKLCRDKLPPNTLEIFSLERVQNS